MFLVAFFLALRERSGRRQPSAERSPGIIYFFHRVLGAGVITAWAPVRKSAQVIDHAATHLL